MRRDDAIALLKANVGRLAAFGVRSLAIFGSVARDAAVETSDIDLLVDFDAPPSFDQYMDLKLFLEDTLGTRVDLVTRRSVKPRILPVVEREAIRVA
jgi:hypothetical protein